MSFPRLTFLYPSFLSIRGSAGRTILKSRPRLHHRYRHGTAVEPTQLHPSPPPLPPRSVADTDVEAKPIIGKNYADIEGDEPAPFFPPVREEQYTAVRESEKEVKPDGDTLAELPLEMEAKPSSPKTEDIVEKPTPTPTPPPATHDHHFDTYSLVKRLEQPGGFTVGQSVAIMKGIRSLLAKNMEEAKDNLVSKSNVENETYLFKAACSELRNEMQNTKKTQLDQLRSEQTRIQTEFDLLNQRFLAEMMSLKDELNGMFNDRKMVTRAEQRAMENKIQELNYKITILINSDLKSEIEKLRWTTTRRGLIAIASLALFIVASLRVNSNNHDNDKKERKKREEHRNERHSHRSPHDAEDHVEVAGASGAGFVSLG